MKDAYKNFLLGSLLHDIGKLTERAKEKKFSHQEQGWKILSGISPEVSKYAKFHHKEDIENCGENNQKKKLLWMVHLADCLSASERGVIENNKELSSENPLLSIFSFLNLNDKDINNKEQDKKFPFYYTFFPLRIGEVLFPEESKDGQRRFISKSEYSKIKRKFEEFEIEKHLNFSFDLWLILLERFASFVPAMTAENETVSLFDHLKITCAFSASLYQIYENLIFDEKISFSEFKEKTEKEILEEEENKKFLLIGGDFSGIQKFVFGTTHHQKSLLRTKGRSLYLEFLSLDIIREILKRSNLTFANVLFNSGGHFYVLAPNLEKIKIIIQEIKNEVNTFLYEKFKGIIYLALAFQEFSGAEIKVKRKNSREKNQKLEERGRKISEVFKNLHKRLAKDKSQKFREILLEDIKYWKEPQFQKEDFAENLCQFCKLNVGKEEEFNMAKLRECEICKNMREMAKNFRAEKEEELRSKEFWLEFIEKMKYQKIGVWKEKNQKENNMAMYFEFPFSLFLLKDFNENFKINLNWRGITLINFYDFKKNEIKNKLSKILLTQKIKEKSPNFLDSYFVSWYSTQFAEEIDQIPFQCIGVKKVGILKGDLDNLGNLFKKGINLHHRTFSNLATFSRMLDLFFKVYINWLGNLEKGLKRNIYATQREIFWKDFEENRKWNKKFKKEERDIQILYSGGDDFVVIGPWNEILDFSLDLEWFFRKYVGGHPALHFSAGLIMIDEKFPIYRAIELTEEKLNIAKKEGKQRISLFEREPVRWKELREVLNEFSENEVKDNKFNKKMIRLEKTEKIKARSEILSRALIHKILETQRKIKKEKNLKYMFYLHYLLARNKFLRENSLFKEYFSFQRDNKGRIKIVDKFNLIDIPLIWLDYLIR